MTKATTPMTKQELENYVKRCMHCLEDTVTRNRVCKTMCEHKLDTFAKAIECTRRMCNCIVEHDTTKYKTFKVERISDTEKVYELRRMMAETMNDVLDASERKEEPLSAGSLDFAFNNFVRRVLYIHNKDLILEKCGKETYPFLGMCRDRQQFMSGLLVVAMYYSIKHGDIEELFDDFVWVMYYNALAFASTYTTGYTGDWYKLCVSSYDTPCGSDVDISPDTLREGLIEYLTPFWKTEEERFIKFAGLKPLHAIVQQHTAYRKPQRRPEPEPAPKSEMDSDEEFERMQRSMIEDLLGPDDCMF